MAKYDDMDVCKLLDKAYASMSESRDSLYNALHAEGGTLNYDLAMVYGHVDGSLIGLYGFIKHACPETTITYPEE